MAALTRATSPGGHSAVRRKIVSALRESFHGEPSLLPGENRRDYELLRQLMIDDIQPRTSIEWLWTFDLVELSWEVLRYGRLKQKVLEANRASAIESILWDLDGEGLPAGTSEMLRLQNRRSAIEWREDPRAATEIEARLRCHGWDAAAINARVFVQARDAFSMLDNLMSAAQGRRLALLREIGTRVSLRSVLKTPLKRV